MRKTLLFIVFFGLLVSSHAVSAQNQEFWVIIGAFAKESNAIRLTNKVKAEYPDATYTLIPSRNLNYVSVLKTTDKKQALSLTLKLQRGIYTDAWMYWVEPTDVTPANEVVETPVEEPVMADTTTVEVTPGETQEVADTVQAEPPFPKPNGKFMIFAIYDPTGQPMPGEVHFVDRVTAKDIATYEGNKRVDVVPPARLRKDMPIVCGLFGYKEDIKFIDYEDPSKVEGATVDDHGVWTIPYHLELLAKKDVSVMYHVSFNKDAVIMLPESKAELDQLVTLMKLNPNYKIKIHGHANGKNKRKIIALGDNEDFFNAEGSKTFTGSAKELSELRAKAVQRYLAINGIDASRSKTYGWGATLQLVKTNSPSASRLNDRIEIEILED